MSISQFFEVWDVGRLGKFVSVGMAATVLHFVCAYLFLALSVGTPFWCNAFGWCAGFVSSYSGHRRFTFGDRTAPYWRSSFRFCVVSVTGLVGNELIFAVLRGACGMKDGFALALALASVAGVSFVSNRVWTFEAA